MPWSNNKKIHGATKLGSDKWLREGWKHENSWFKILFTDVLTSFVGSYSSIPADQSIRIYQNDLDVWPPWITQELLVIRFNDRCEEDILSAQKAIIDTRKVGCDVHLLYGQSEEKHGEAFFHRRVLKEFSFDIHKTDWPEAMTMFIKEYKLIQHEDTVKRKLLCTSKYNFYYDEDEDFAGKLWLQVTDAGGEEICNTVYTRRDSENRSYWDIGDYLPEEHYVFEEAEADISSGSETDEAAYQRQPNNYRKVEHKPCVMLMEDYLSDPNYVEA